MFEKEAEEWVKENMDCCKTDNSVNQSIPYFDEEERCCAKSAFQDGAEFGYNKANEWHFVSKEGQPNKDDIYLTIRKDGLHLGDYCQGGDGDIDCQSWCDYPSEEEIQDDSVIAWKEIVLPKEDERK